jgi:hypothetical protein
MVLSGHGAPWEFGTYHQHAVSLDASVIIIIVVITNRQTRMAPARVLQPLLVSTCSTGLNTSHGI